MRILQKYIISVIDIYNWISDFTKYKCINVTGYCRTIYCINCNKLWTVYRIFIVLRPPVSDWCHLTGPFRPLLCYHCKIKIKLFTYILYTVDHTVIIPIYKYLSCLSYNIYVTMNSSENYILFCKHTTHGVILTFVDTFRFLNDSLCPLARHLAICLFQQTRICFLMKMYLLKKQTKTFI